MDRAAHRILQAETRKSPHSQSNEAAANPNNNDNREGSKNVNNEKRTLREPQMSSEDEDDRYKDTKL